MIKTRRKITVGAFSLAALVGNVGCMDLMMFGASQAIAHNRSQKNKAVDNAQAVQIEALRREVERLKNGEYQEEAYHQQNYIVPSKKELELMQRSATIENTKEGLVDMRLSAYIGISPMVLCYTVKIPNDSLRGADVLWMDNGRPISRGISGQWTLNMPGKHEIEALIALKDNEIYKTSKTVTILERLNIGNN
jgi:hypothetical protein